MNSDMLKSLDGITATSVDKYLRFSGWEKDVYFANPKMWVYHHPDDPEFRIAIPSDDNNKAFRKRLMEVVETICDIQGTAKDDVIAQMKGDYSDSIIPGTSSTVWSCDSQCQFPCEESTERELSLDVQRMLDGQLHRTDVGGHLVRCTCPIPTVFIPWNSITYLEIIETQNQAHIEVIRKYNLSPGAYINRNGNWLLLIHPEEKLVRNTLEQYGNDFLSLGIYGANFSALEKINPSKLASLYLQSCETDIPLPKLEHLTGLHHLGIAGFQSVTRAPWLDELTELVSLEIIDCPSLLSLPNIEELTKLSVLCLARTAIMRVPDCIRRLKSLRKLDLRALHLQQLPDWLPEISEEFLRHSWGDELGTKKAVVLLDDTTVDGLDMSIFEQPFEMIAQWFAAQKSKPHPLNEIKVAFLGDGEAGKSYTISRLMNDGGDPVDYVSHSTPGIVIKDKVYSMDGRNVRVHYWDFGGQEIMHAMHRIFLTGRTMYVVLLNARDDTQGDRARYWLHNIQSFAPDSPVLLVLNKIDQNENASVDERYLRRRYPKLTQVVKLSAKYFSQEEFNSRFTSVLLEEIQKSGYLDAMWPASWLRVKQKLENMENHYIVGSTYQTICEECQVDDNQKNLLQWFNDLGVSFCCCDEGDYALEDYVILRPDWITNALYIILFNKLEGAKNGLIPHASIYKILKNAHSDPAIRCTLPQARYNSGDVQYVLGVMRKFSLSFPYGDEQEFIPMLCQQDSTADVQYYHKDADVLEFNMEFDYLPNNLLHRLMVERHAELDMENVWRTGARFQQPKLGLSAVVVIDGNILRFFIRHTNEMHRPNTYLTMLKANVDRIVKKMGLKTPECQLVYKLNGRSDSFDYEMLKAMQDSGQSQVFSMSHRRMIPITDIINQTAPESLDSERKLLQSVQKACEQIQQERIFRSSTEDNLNRRMRDVLESRGYEVYDQQQMSSSSRKYVGELNLILYRGEQDLKKPWSIIESLRISDASKRDWNSHLGKLLANYNPHGVPFLFLVTYANCSKEQFEKIWNGYQKHIQQHNAGDFEYEADSFRILNSKQDGCFIQTAVSRYRCGGYMPTVYHIFVQMDPKP